MTEPDSSAYLFFHFPRVELFKDSVKLLNLTHLFLNSSFSLFCSYSILNLCLTLWPSVLFLFFPWSFSSLSAYSSSVSRLNSRGMRQNSSRMKTLLFKTQARKTTYSSSFTTEPGTVRKEMNEWERVVKLNYFTNLPSFTQSVIDDIPFATSR